MINLKFLFSRGENASRRINMQFISSLFVAAGVWFGNLRIFVLLFTGKTVKLHHDVKFSANKRIFSSIFSRSLFSALENCHESVHSRLVFENDENVVLQPSPKGMEM